jgi:hypothetical protein
MTRIGSQRHREKIYIYIILWDHHRICGPSFFETSLCGAYLYLEDIFVVLFIPALISVEIMGETLVFTSQRTQSVFIIRATCSVLLMEIIGLCCENGTSCAVWSERRIS